MSTTVEQIKDRLGIVDVIGSYITLEKSGANFKARCPFHNEKTPSFFVSVDRNSYYCFGCGVKGDIFSFVQEFESLDFLGALKVLAEKSGVPLTSFRSEQNSEKKSEEEKLFEVLEAASQFFQKNLADSKETLIYLKNRGLHIDMVRSWKVGYAIDEWRALKDYLLGKGFAEQNLLKAGLIKQGDKGTYDRFRSRVMFPIFDSSGRVIAFSGRILGKETEHEPKYLNSPETPLFEKSKVLYGMDKAKYAIKEKRFAILVEGQMDLLMSHQVGFANTVASSGTSLTVDHVKSIRRFTDTLVIAYDNDNAGANASFKAWQMALAAGLEVKVAALPQGFDPAQAVLENPSLWKNAVEQGTHVIDYFLDMAKGKSEKESDDLIKNTILPLIRSLESTIDQSRFVRKIALSSGIAESALWEELSKIEILAADVTSDGTKKKVAADSARKALSFLYYLEKKHPEQASAFKEKLGGVLPDLAERLAGVHEEAEVMIYEAEAHYGNSPNSPNLWENEILYHLEEDVLKENFSSAMLTLRRAEDKKDRDEIEKEAKRLDDISKRLGKLQKKYFNN